MDNLQGNEQPVDSASTYSPPPEYPLAGPPPAPKRQGRRMWLIAAGLAAIFILAMGVTIGAVLPDGTATGAPRVQNIVSTDVYDEAKVTSLYDTVIPAIAKIETRQAQASGLPFFSQSQGSGFLVDSDGRFVTNYHVIDGATRVTVILQDGRRSSGEVIGSDPNNDVAVVKVPADFVKGVAPLAFADSAKVRPGQMAIAIGSPLGEQGTVTVGVVSGVNRTLPSVTRRSIVGMISTDAQIFPGNSGGPLLNSSAEVIGINTAVTTGDQARLGYAVPSNTAKSVYLRITSTPGTGGGAVTVKRAWLGVTISTLDAESAANLGLSVQRGVYVTSVVPDSPASKAGLRPATTATGGLAGPGGDVILGVDGKAVATADELIAAFNNKSPGDKVTLRILRSNRETNLEVTLGEFPTSLN
ncbi:MAG: PDZ domain-containing protein [Chloroflexi bacterium]|nr:PDZ domain-containing protein [Chloroflexota bacterium]